jgi:hypothetical protein
MTIEKKEQGARTKKKATSKISEMMMLEKIIIKNTKVIFFKQ